MKFTNGYWRFRDGFVPYFPAEVYKTAVDNGVLTVFAPTRQINHRGATLGCPVLTLTISSPMEDVVKVRVEHFRGGAPKKPAFKTADLSPRTAVKEDAETVSLTSGGLTVRLRKKQGWKIEFLSSGNVLTDSSSRNMGYMARPAGGDEGYWFNAETNGTAFMKEELAISVGECLYGLGERFSALVKNGQSVEIWNEDGGTASEQTYKNVPFYLSNRGYGVFVNNPGPVSFEVGSEKVSRAGFSVEGESLEYYLINGPDPKKVLERYTLLTGRPALPPAWSFGLWLTTSFTTDYDEKTVTSFIQGMKDRRLPLHVFHFDCFWMKGFQWCDLLWDRDCFPDPKAMLGRLKKNYGLRICVWINPYIAQQSVLFAEGAAKGYFLKKEDGGVWQCDEWQAGMAFVDFTNPSARSWYKQKLAALLDDGVDCFKTDFGERIPTNAVYHDGSDPVLMHNYYTFLYNQTVFELLEERFGKAGACLFARSATAGGQQFPVHWGGDCSSTWESMAETLRGGLSLGMSGFGFWSHDISGFENTAPPDVYKRWVAFGLLSSHSRLHGNSSYRVPWLFDEEAVDVLRLFTELKCRLMPYLWSKALEAAGKGVPMLRAMVLEFPGDPGCSHLDRQYMLGDSLLVAPVMRSDNRVEYYLPAGRWTNFLDGRIVEGGRWVEETHGFKSLPLMVRPGSVIPVGPVADRPDYDTARDCVWHVFDFGDGLAASVRIGDGSSGLECSRLGPVFSFAAVNASGAWKVLFRNHKAADFSDAKGMKDTPQGAEIALPKSGSLTVSLK